MCCKCVQCCVKMAYILNKCNSLPMCNLWMSQKEIFIRGAVIRHEQT